MIEQCDYVIIGGGVVGLAIARAAAIKGRDVLLLEAENSIGTGSSSRNSEVIHAGLYYPKNSLKASLCRLGRKKIYSYCKTYGVKTQKKTKLIFANNASEQNQLKILKNNAEENGVKLDWLTCEDVKKLEPNLRCHSALLSRETGIIDSHGFMLALKGNIETHGGAIAFNAKVISGEHHNNKVILNVKNDNNNIKLSCQTVVNCSGLEADKLSKTINGVNPQSIPQIFYAKGNYFYLNGKSPFSRLIYPIPSASGLGIHFTLDLNGQGRFGPDIEWVDSINYNVDAKRSEAFCQQIRKYLPTLNNDAIRPGYSGIRSKVQKKGEPMRDFIIHTPLETGCPGFFSLYGIESPGLTASLAIADHITNM